MINKDHMSSTEAMLKLSTIPRWGMVEMARPQSVAEHSFNVWILSTSLYRVMFPVEHNSFDFKMLQTWALVHDMDEIFTGDIPSPAKDVLNAIHPGITAQLKYEVLKNTIPDAAHAIAGIKGTLVYSIVKIAESVETMRFAISYALLSSARMEVMKFMGGKLREAYHDARQRFQVHDWGLAQEWVEALLYRGILTVPQPLGTSPETESGSEEHPSTDSSEAGG